MRARVGPCAVALCLLLIAGVVWAETAKIFYFYDQLNRLATVVDQQGNVATYTYDAVGNLLKIDRIDSAASPGQVGITLVTPNEGTPGTTVRIFGKGFSATPGQNAVAFNGTPATVTDTTPNSMVVTVPAAARTGFITVTTPQGSATSPTRFTVIGLLTIAPPGAVVLVAATRQFTASDSVNPGAVFAWSVNGIAGGNPNVGTVTSSGLYTAPANVPTPPTVTLTAAENGVTSASVSAQALVVSAPVPATVSAGSVSVQLQATPSSQTTSSGRPVSVQLQAAATASQSGTSSARPVSAQVQAAPPTPASATSSGRPVSVQLQAAATASQSGTSSARPVSVQVQAAPPSPATAIASAVGAALSLQPFISAVSPSSAAVGSANVTVTVVGSGFSGATGITFLRNSVADTAITVANLAVDTGGTKATITISVAAGAPTGGRVVQIAVPGRTSTAAGLGGNTFIVQ